MNFVLEQIEKTLEEIDTIVNLENTDARQEYITKNFPDTKIHRGMEIYFLTGVISTDVEYLKHYITTYKKYIEESEEKLINDFISNY